MPEQILLDYNLMMAPHLGGHGIQPERLTAAAETFRAAHQLVAKWRNEGRLGFFDLTGERETLGRILQYSAERRGEFDNIVVLGIGGSALGTTALREALCPPNWNELDSEQRRGLPRLYILDNIDPTTIAPLLERLDLRRTLFNVVSKSGTTAETMAQFLIIRERLAAACGHEEARRNLVFTTDPTTGLLRRIATDEAIETLPIPPNVGGRFSVLSPVGLLPAALVGIDIAALLEGARTMDERCRGDKLEENPAGLFATLQFLADTERQAHCQVLMPYSDRLAAIADWFRQLWAESLGKRHDLNGNEVFRGPTPIRALGATDQHSQTQLYMEGPRDKTITFLTIRELDTDLPIPNLYPDADALAYLGGHTLGQLLRAEENATARALAREGRMNMTIELPALTAHTLGQLLMLFQIATVYAGALYYIDPLDQPGVELGKQLTYALMGRPGYDAPPTTEPDPRWICRQ
jgi:glucose-6-phosphate isomerase